MITLILFLISCLGPLINISALNTCPDCGNSTVPFPLSTNQNCGDSRYKIYCNNGILEFLSATGTYYNILSIDQNANKLVINPSLIMKDTCYSSDLQEGAMSSHRIRIRVGGCTAYTSLVDFKVNESIDSWNFGIELQWVPTN
ncbi:hypothetical protein Lal_00036480 [Lupinus albus]|nr:hypothetical protein Lal_00036480 [Lupinus albus]